MINNLQEKNDQVIQNIKTLQSTEMNLYNSLDSQSLTTDQKKKIINQINEISQMRINLYNILKNNYSGYKENVSFSRNMLSDQLVSVDFIEDELNESKRRLNLIEEQKNNKIRLVEINTYYGKQYNAHKKIMQIIVIMCIPILILNILANKELIPSKLNILLNIIIIVLGLTIIGYNIIDISNRSNMNFDEYSWQFNREEALKSTPSSNVGMNDLNSDPWGIRLPQFTCVGDECCNNTSAYDEKLNKCIPFT